MSRNIPVCGSWPLCCSPLKMTWLVSGLWISRSRPCLVMVALAEMPTLKEVITLVAVLLRQIWHLLIRGPPRFAGHFSGSFLSHYWVFLPIVLVFSLNRMSLWVSGENVKKNGFTVGADETHGRRLFNLSKFTAEVGAHTLGWLHSLNIKAVVQRESLSSQKTSFGAPGHTFLPHSHPLPATIVDVQYNEMQKGLWRVFSNWPSSFILLSTYSTQRNLTQTQLRLPLSHRGECVGQKTQ